MGVLVKVFTGRTVSGGQNKRFNIEDWLVNHEIVEFPISKTDRYDDLLHKCAIKCHITPCHLPLFALWNTEKQSWMKPSDTVSGANSTVQLEFRVRFVVRTEVKKEEQKKRAHRYGLVGDESIPIMDDVVTEYYFHQRREDFLLDRVKFSDKGKSENEILSEALGVAVLDTLCIAKAANLRLSTARRKVKFKRLLPRSCRDLLSRFNFFNRLRVKNKFKHFITHFTPSHQNWLKNGRNLAFFQERYLLNLELNSDSYGVETYNLVENGTVCVSADSGIVADTAGNPEKWCDISDLTNMSLQVRNPETQQANRSSNSNQCTVSLGKFDGSVKEFVMKNVTCAENLASCIEGYYHLLVDAHHYLCKEVCSPSLVKQLEYNCHGPITSDFSVDLLHKREDLRVGDCILRQSQEAYDEYFMHVVRLVTPLDIRNFKMDRNANGFLGLLGLVHSHRYKTVEELIAASAGGCYEGELIYFNPAKTISPKPKHKSNLIVRLCSSDETADGSGHSDIHDARPNLALLKLEDYQSVSFLGNGVFSHVRRYTRRGGNYVVFKLVPEQRDDQALDHHINRCFQKSTEMLNRLNHRHIIKNLGMSLNNMVALEYAHFGSITTYLRGNLRRSNTEWPSWFLQVLWQITHACHYLEELGFAHGNLRGKNILLQSDFPQPHIRLADPGVTTRTITNRIRTSMPHLTAPWEPILPAPWLSYEFCNVDSQPLEWDSYPTIEGDKWSFATTVCEILNWGCISVDPMNAYMMTNEMKSFYRTGGFSRWLPKLITDNEGLCKLIRLCWSIDGRKRPPFQQILREIGSTLTSDYVFLRMATGPVSDVTITLEHGLPTYEDEKLTFHRKLGEGHFGVVGQYAYDQYRNGMTVMVAVKASKTSALQQQREFKQEVETMRRLNNPYVVRLLGIADPSGRIVMEYLENGSLVDELRRRKLHSKVPTAVLLRYSSQIAEGMMALQEKRLIHRDLALRNILLGSDPDNLHIKISDFGLSRFLSEDSDYYVGNLEEFPPLWYAPECLCLQPRKAFLFESDVWSYGVTIWEMFSHGERPMYRGVPEVGLEQLPRLKEHLRLGHRLSHTPDCPSAVYAIMEECWKFTPSERLKFGDIKAKFDQLINCNIFA